jgi:hypothetical protein
VDFANLRWHTDRVERPAQSPEGRLIERLMTRKNLTARACAPKAGISEGRWRQITNGYQAMGRGEYTRVTAPDSTLARMAKVVGITPEQLREVDREVAAEILSDLLTAEAEEAPAQGVDHEKWLTAIAENESRPTHMRDWAKSLLMQFAAIRRAEEEEEARDEEPDQRAG